MKNYVLWALLIVLNGVLWAQNGTEEIALEDIVNERFEQVELTSFQFMNDGEHYARGESGNRIVKYALRTGEKVEDLMTSEFRDWDGDIDDFVFSEDNNLILFWTNKERVYRRSYMAQYYLYDRRVKRLVALSNGDKLQAARISPDASKVAFIKENNIYIYNVSFKSTRQVTEDGALNKIINGIPDWVYEEEFELNCMMEWSPDSKLLAWVKFDESQVPEYSFPIYGSEGLENNYESRYTLKYPKAGAENSEVSVNVYDYDNKVTRLVDLDTQDAYVPNVFWTKDASQLGIARLNRYQNNLQILFANPKSGICTIIITEEDDCYIDLPSYKNITILDDEEHFVYQSEADGYNHLYLYNMSGRMVRKITKGEYDVTAFVGYDPKTKKYYYQAAQKSPLEREVYSVNAKGVVECVTPKAGNNTLLFSPLCTYSIQTYASATQPLIAKVYDRKGTALYTFHDNSSLKEDLKAFRLSSKEFITVPNGQGDSLNAWLVKPTNFDSQKQYPLLMVQYSGPGSQEVLNDFEIGWEQYLANLGYIVASVDGRGTGARGEAFKKCTYKQLGRYESDDQIAAAQYLASQAYIDENRVGIWGWSYGGFVSALSMSRSDVFKAGIAVAPVTHFKFYDTAYTERFMRSPKENQDAYNAYAPLALASQLNGRLLLCHGTADENVHYQNSVMYSDALVKAGKQFEMMTYRNGTHSLKSNGERSHLYRRFVDFLEKNL